MNIIDNLSKSAGAYNNIWGEVIRAKRAPKGYTNTRDVLYHAGSVTDYGVKYYTTPTAEMLATTLDNTNACYYGNTFVKSNALNWIEYFYDKEGVKLEFDKTTLTLDGIPYTYVVGGLSLKDNKWIKIYYNESLNNYKYFISEDNNILGVYSEFERDTSIWEYIHANNVTKQSLFYYQGKHYLGYENNLYTSVNFLDWEIEISNFFDETLSSLETRNFFVNFVGNDWVMSTTFTIDGVEKDFIYNLQTKEKIILDDIENKLVTDYWGSFKSYNHIKDNILINKYNELIISAIKNTSGSNYNIDIVILDLNDLTKVAKSITVNGINQSTFYPLVKRMPINSGLFVYVRGTIASDGTAYFDDAFPVYEFTYQDEQFFKEKIAPLATVSNTSSNARNTTIASNFVNIQYGSAIYKQYFKADIPKARIEDELQYYIKI